MSHGRFITLMGILAILILAVFFSTRIHLAVRFTRPCRLLAQAEWLLLQTGPDTFEARLLDRRNGNRQKIDLFRFQRGDVVHFSLSPGVVPGAAIPAGQEVARLDSYESRMVLEQLGPQLQEAQAGFRASKTGAKSEVIAQARSQVEAALAESNRRVSEFERAVSLRQQGVVSQAEYERAEARCQQAQAELDAVRNQLLAAESGEKEAVIEGWRARIRLLKQQIEDAQGRIEAQRIRCPIDGEVATLQADTALVRVTSLDTLYAIAPLSPSRAGRIGPGQTAWIMPMGIQGRGFPGRVVRVDRHAAAQAGRTFFWATVAVPNLEGQLAAGIRGRLRFHGERVSLLAWITDRLRHASDRSLGA